MLYYFCLPNLQSFITGRQSFYETTSLTLSSHSIKFYFSLYLPKLQFFEIGNISFFSTTSLSLSSNSIQSYFRLYLSNLQSFKIGKYSFYNTKFLCLSLSSNSIIFTIVYIFLIYNHLEQEENHSLQQQVYLYQVILLYSILI